MIKKVRVLLFKEIIMDAECEKVKFLDTEEWVPKDTNLLLDAVRDHGEEFEFDYDIIR